MHHRTAGASLTGIWDATDKLKLTSVTSYDYGNVTVPEDADGSPLDVLSDTTGGRAWQFSQDLRLSSDFSSGPNFILGAYYNHELIKAGSSYAYLTGVDTNGDGVADVDLAEIGGAADEAGRGNECCGGRHVLLPPCQAVGLADGRC